MCSSACTIPPSLIVVVADGDGLAFERLDPLWLEVTGAAGSCECVLEPRVYHAQGIPLAFYQVELVGVCAAPKVGGVVPARAEYPGAFVANLAVAVYKTAEYTNVMLVVGLLEGDCRKRAFAV